MKAMVIVQTKGGGKLELRDVPKPEPGPEELLIRVKAAGVNRADIYQVKGTYDPTKNVADEVIAGAEAAGEVVGMGEHVSGFAVGDRLMGMCKGGYAEFTAWIIEWSFLCQHA